ncbi:NAD(P)H-hydrate epimerase [Candidatus Woesearchaeota archaeon]|nr:NAD(P)H-hydrate epimerase [Candidatus Woesearchaeota archaeon]
MAVTVQEMKSLEDAAEKHGTPKLVLMERAAEGIVAVLERKFDLQDKTILFVCYHGNNGGDGFAAARIMHEKGYSAKVLFIGEEAKLKAEARENYVRLRESEKSAGQIFVDRFIDANIIVDAILGLSASGPLAPALVVAVDRINASSAIKVSIDIPTGIDPDAKVVHRPSVRSDLIITMHDLKPCLLPYRDKTAVVDIFLH